MNQPPHVRRSGPDFLHTVGIIAMVRRRIEDCFRRMHNDILHRLCST